MDRWHRDSRVHADEQSSVIVSPAATRFAKFSISHRFTFCSLRYCRRYWGHGMGDDASV